MCRHISLSFQLIFLNYNLPRIEGQNMRRRVSILLFVFVETICNEKRFYGQVRNRDKHHGLEGSGGQG